MQLWEEISKQTRISRSLFRLRLWCTIGSALVRFVSGLARLESGYGEMARVSLPTELLLFLSFPSWW